MTGYEYRVVPAPRRAQKVKGAKTPAERFATTLSGLMNLEATNGWEFVRAETLPCDERKGMFSSTRETYHSVLVFRRPLPERVEMSNPRPFRPNSAARREDPRLTTVADPAQVPRITPVRDE